MSGVEHLELFKDDENYERRLRNINYHLERLSLEEKVLAGNAKTLLDDFWKRVKAMVQKGIH